jgi:hypothetical protein
VASTHNFAVVFTVLLSVVFVLLAPGISLPRTTLRPKIAAENVIASLRAMISAKFVPRTTSILQAREQQRPALPADSLYLNCTLLC